MKQRVSPAAKISSECIQDPVWFHCPVWTNLESPDIFIDDPCKTGKLKVETQMMGLSEASATNGE